MSQFRSLLIEPDKNGIQTAAKNLREGKLVAFPTETVYGLGANALNTEAVLDIFKAKGRPLTDPLIVHIAEPTEARRLMDVSPVEERMFSVLTQAFWPGPLTIIVKASAVIPPPVTANTGFVGIRCPNHRLARMLIAESGVPIAAPSANRFGHVSPTRADHVLSDLGEKGVNVVNGESSEHCYDPPCQFGIESTVLKLEGSHNRATIFRQGAITQRQIESVLKNNGLEIELQAVSRTVKMHSTAADKSTPQPSASATAQNEENQGEVAPGQAVTHYAPDVPCFIVKSFTEESSSSSSSSRQGDAIDERDITLSSEELLSSVILIDYGRKFESLAPKVLAYRDLSPAKDSIEAARSLFDTLRWSEAIAGAKYVFVTPVEKKSDETGKEEIIEEQRLLLSSALSNGVDDMSLGVADRIFRAASGMYAHVKIFPSSA
eukprot:gene13089-14358_t